MKVNEPKVLLYPRFGGPTSRVSGAPARAADRVGVSDTDRLLAGLKAEVGPLDVLREEKVTGLRAVMAKGNYSADIQDVARQFLRELLGQLLA
jgi:anti-sigma28 factor (negative regulator of flagellin synthesis)